MVVKLTSRWQSRRALPTRSDVNLHGNFDGVVDLNSEARKFELSERALNLSQIEDECLRLVKRQAENARIELAGGPDATTICDLR